MVQRFDVDSCEISVSKHFKNTWMRKWNWDYADLREAIKNAYKVDKVGKKKYEVYVRKKGLKKIIFAYYTEFDTVFVITCAEGR